MNFNELTPRLIAKTEGKKRYQGQPCINGHIGIRYVRNHECVDCKNIATCLRSRKKREFLGRKVGRPRKYPDLIGPPKPKRIVFCPVSVEDKWIVRSKSCSSIRKNRRGLSIKYYKTLIVTHCPLLGIKLSYEKFEGNTPSNYATLDRIDSRLGYDEGNVQIISFRANTLKSNATLEELQLLVKNWERL